MTSARAAFAHANERATFSAIVLVARVAYLCPGLRAVEAGLTCVETGCDRRASVIGAMQYSMCLAFGLVPGRNLLTT